MNSEFSWTCKHTCSYLASTSFLGGSLSILALSLLVNTPINNNSVS